MTSRTVVVIAFAAAAFTAAADRAAAQSTTRPVSFRERYGVLVERNIFLRERGRPAPTSRPAAPPRSPEQQLVLTGIVLEDDVYRAYVEDRRQNSILKLAVGDRVVGGTVAAVTIDAVTWARDGRETAIAIGQDFTGARAAAAAAPVAAAGTTPTTAPAGGAGATPPAAGNLSAIEQRLREQRLLREQQRQQQQQGGR